MSLNIIGLEERYEYIGIFKLQFNKSFMAISIKKIPSFPVNYFLLKIIKFNFF